MAKDNDAKKRLLNPSSSVVDEPKSNAAPSICDDGMGSNYFCQVSGHGELDTHCELTGVRVASVPPTATNLAKTNDQILNTCGVDVPGQNVNQSGGTFDWNYNFDSNLSPPGIAGDADGHLFVARVSFASDTIGDCDQEPITVRVVYQPNNKAAVKQSDEAGTKDGAETKDDCGCKGRKTVNPKPIDTFPVDIQDDWLRYQIFQPSSPQGNRLMIPGLDMDEDGKLHPIPLRARQLAVVASNVQWRPDSRRPILIQQPQGLPDFGDRDLGPIRFPGLPKFSSVICQYGDRTNSVLTSQCRQNPQHVLLNSNLDVLFQTNVGVDGFEQRQGIIELWIKVVVPV